MRINLLTTTRADTSTAALEIEIARVTADIDAAFWRIARCRRAGPAPAAWFNRRGALRGVLRRRLRGAA